MEKPRWLNIWCCQECFFKKYPITDGFEQDNYTLCSRTGNRIISGNIFNPDCPLTLVEDMDVNDKKLDFE